MMKDQDERDFADVIAEVRTDEGHEPSPLFWEHFSRRVSEAINQEPDLAPRRWAWLPNPAAAWAAGASTLVLLLVAVTWWATLAPRVPAPSVVASPAEEAAAAGQAPSLDDADGDEAWAVVRVAADAWHWDDAQEAGLSAHPGAAESVALELTSEERSELARLIEAEMHRTGAL